MIHYKPRNIHDNMPRAHTTYCKHVLPMLTLAIQRVQDRWLWVLVYVRTYGGTCLRLRISCIHVRAPTHWPVRTRCTHQASYRRTRAFDVGDGMALELRGLACRNIPLSVKTQVLLSEPFALQSTSRNWSPALMFKLRRLILPHIYLLLRRSVFFTDAGMSTRGRVHG